MEKIKAFLRREWAMLSTRFGLVLTAVSTVAPIYAPFDQRVAWAGMATGVVLILYRGKTSGN